MEVFYKKKTKTSILGRISKLLKLFVFRQILAVLGSFREFGQIWANFVALAIANSMHKFWLKS
jgi:hypothetical protein